MPFLVGIHLRDTKIRIHGLGKVGAACTSRVPPEKKILCFYFVSLGTRAHRRRRAQPWQKRLHDSVGPVRRTRAAPLAFFGRDTPQGYKNTDTLAWKSRGCMHFEGASGKKDSVFLFPLKFTVTHSVAGVLIVLYEPVDAAESLHNPPRHTPTVRPGRAEETCLFRQGIHLRDTEIRIHGLEKVGTRSTQKHL